MKRLSLLLTLASAAALSTGLAAERALSETQLQRALQRYPEADADKDGKLSVEEARAHLRKLRAGDTAPAPPTATDGKTAARAQKKSRRNTGAPAPDFADVSYGPHPNNKLDLWLAKSDRPAPLVVFIHGGGFVGGDKSTFSGTMLQQCLEAGVSFASINYRFRTEAAINVVLRDSARALQFLRANAGDYQLDKRIAVCGGSAGAGTSLWLAFHDDLADPQNADPVLRESTRVSAAAASGCQATYDILQWRDVLGSEEAMRFYPQSTWPAFYGLKTLDELQTDEGKRLRADADMLGLVTPDDPPVWLGAGEGHDALANKGDTNHSPKHAEAVKKRCDEIGVRAVLKIGNRVTAPAGAAGDRSQVDFLLQHLTAAGSK